MFSCIYYSIRTNKCLTWNDLLRLQMKNIIGHFLSYNPKISSDVIT